MAEGGVWCVGRVDSLSLRYVYQYLLINDNDSDEDGNIN